MVALLLVDDEPAITDNLAPLLRRSGFTVDVAADGDSALSRIRAGGSDLVVLDVMLPGTDGREVLRTARAEGRTTPIILLTQVGESSERAMALEEGADDYLNKPFDPYELIARVRAVLRELRQGGSTVPIILLTQVGESVERAMALEEGADDYLNKPFDPHELVARIRAVLRRRGEPEEAVPQALEAVWGWSYATGTRSVDARVAELRRVLEADSSDPTMIVTAPGSGYRFAARVEPA